jgi:hypothetical protein
MAAAPLYKKSNMGWFMPVVYFFLGTFFMDAIFKFMRAFK